jgi:O-antigen/teichoic acid export membrane protein
VTVLSETRARTDSPRDDPGEGRRAVRDSLIVTVGGQLEQVLGTLTSLALRWGLDPARLGVYTGLRPYLDNTNRSSLGVGLGAVQEIPILRAAGKHEEARRIADIAYTTNSITCIIYAALVLAWGAVRAPSLANNPLAFEWTWGLVGMVALVPLKRYQDFLIAVLRAHQEFALVTELAIVDSMLSAVTTVVGLWLAGFWGLIASVGVLMIFNIVYLHARQSFRFRWAWNWPTVVRLMTVGMPIWANTGLYFAVLNLDRGLILWLVPDGERATGLYTIALMGTGWGLDLAGRIALVMYTYFQTTLGRTSDEVLVARQAIATAEAQAPVLGAGAAVAYLVGPVFLGALLPRYAEGLPALRPLLPGVVLLGLSWPARQMLITVNRPYRLAVAMIAGLAVIAGAGAIGALRDGIVGVAWGMTIGYAAVFLATGWAAFGTILGPRAWLGHQARLAGELAWFGCVALIASHLPLPEGWLGHWGAFATRCVLLVGLGLPRLWLWANEHGWGGLLDRWKR